MNFLYAAYGATWMIHLIYLGTLLHRYLRLRKEVEELEHK
jgi:CcmD family protein